MNHIKDQIKHAIENQEELIKMFAKEPDKKLLDRIRINHLLYALAEKANNEEAGEFLNIMERIIAEARLYKWDNNVPDEIDEMEQTLAEMDLAHEKHERRNKLLAKLNKPVIPPEPEQSSSEPKTDNNVQLGLF